MHELWARLLRNFQIEQLQIRLRLWRELPSEVEHLSGLGSCLPKVKNVYNIEWGFQNCSSEQAWANQGCNPF